MRNRATNISTSSFRFVAAIGIQQKFELKNAGFNVEPDSDSDFAPGAYIPDSQTTETRTSPAKRKRRSRVLEASARPAKRKRSEKFGLLNFVQEGQFITCNLQSFIAELLTGQMSSLNALVIDQDRFYLLSC